MSEDNVIKRVSEELGYPEDVVRLVYKSQFRFIIDHIRNLPLSIKMSRDEFDKLTTNFSLLELGKLYCTWDNIQKRKRYYEYVVPEKIMKNARKNTESDQAEGQ